MKPRVMSLVVFTALAGLMIAPGSLHPVIGFIALLASPSAPARPARSTCGTTPTSTP
jgi:heme O synthase-like polyprenyltransferase